MKIKHLLISLSVSCLFYISLFSFVVHKPLTIGIMREYWEKKVSHLSSIDRNKIVILAGSNGRFSHRCETLETEYAIPCANMSIAAGLSLDYQFSIIRTYLVAGDVVYLPLEYGFLSGAEEDRMNGEELPYIVAYDHQHLIRMKPRKIVSSLFYFDVPFLITGLGEMFLHRMGVTKRHGIDTVTPQGDEAGHNKSKSIAYRDAMNELEWTSPTLNRFNAKSHRAGIVNDIMNWATSNKVKVIGGLPTTFNDNPVPDELIGKMKNFYTAKGHYFLLLDNKSQYPRAYFYDSSYHLMEEYQIAHTRLIAPYLEKILDSAY